MMNHDLLAEVFHREIVKQEEAQKRRRMEKAHEEVLLLMEQEAAARELEHKNELVKMRWEHAEEVPFCFCRAPGTVLRFFFLLFFSGLRLMSESCLYGVFDYF